MTRCPRVESFPAKRLDGLLDEPRPGTPRRLSDAEVERVQTMTREPTPAAVALQPHRSETFKPLFSPRGEAKCVRGPSVQGARRSARGGVLEQYVEHGEQAQRSSGGPMACFDRQVVRNAG